MEGEILYKQRLILGWLENVMLMTYPDSRGRRVLEMTNGTNLFTLIVGSTFRHAGYRQTTLNMSVASENITGNILNWGIIEDFIVSDH